MDGLSGAASAIAIVSLAVQLVDTVQEISKFLKNVQDAPIEVLRLLETLEQLQGTLDNVRQLIEHQFLVLRLPGSPAFITKAIENCEKQIKALETVVWNAKRSLGHQHMLRRTWSSMKVVAKKQDIEDIQCRLRDAKMDLQFALSSNSWQLQMYHIQNTVPVVHQILQTQSMSTLYPALDKKECEVSPGYEISSLRSTPKMGSPSLYTEQECVLWYGGIFGTITLRKTSKYSQTVKAGASGKIPLVNKTVWTFRPSFISFTLQLLYARSFGYVSRNLNTYPVLSGSDPIFSICLDGDLSGLQTALSRQRVSPFVTDESGWTLLHYAAISCQSETCNWLLQIGLDADVTDHDGRSALSCAGWHGLWCQRNEYAYFENKTVDTYRVLAQNQDNISAFEFYAATAVYEPPPEGVDILLAHSSLNFEPFDVAESVDTTPVLAVTVRSYSRAFCLENGPRLNSDLVRLKAESKRWEPLIKRLIHKGTDLHVPVPRDSVYSIFYLPSHVSTYGTPLDVLFEFSETPDEAKTIGAKWLRLLASEGHDVVAYLKKETILHTPDHQMTHPTCPHYGDDIYPVLRELQFTFDDARPSVWWDWWTDPASEIDLLEREFKGMIKYTCLLAQRWYPTYTLIDTWPFQYPVWYDNAEKVAQDWMKKGMEPTERRRRARVAMQRANRRLEKRYAKNTYSKSLRHSRMPGAWPASSWD